MANDVVDTVHTQLNGHSKELGDGVVRTEQPLHVHLVEDPLKRLLLRHSIGLGHRQGHPVAENVFGLVRDGRGLHFVAGRQVFVPVANHRQGDDRQLVHLAALRALRGQRGVVQSNDLQKVSHGLGRLFADQGDAMQRIEDRGDVTVDAAGLFDHAVPKEVHGEVQSRIAS